MRKTTSIFLTLFVTIASTMAQTVTTFTDGTPDDAIAIDADGNVYASNFTGDTVFKFDNSGNAMPFVTGLNTPNGLAFDNDGNLYVCDFSAQTIFKFDGDGNQLDAFPIAGNPSGLIKKPSGDDLVFSVYNQNSLYNLTPDGTITLLSNAAEFNGPVGLAYDETGTLYVGNYNDREIYRLESNGDVTYIAQLPTDGGPLPNLGFIAYGQGRIWGTTMGSDKIFSVNPDGVDDYSLFAGSTQGGDDGDIAIATFNTPNGILFNDAEDTMYITDFGPKNLRVISGVVLSTSDVIAKKSEVILAPNPVRDNLKLRISGFEHSMLQMAIYDISGRIVFSSELNFEGTQFTGTIDVQSWSKGVYFVEVDDGNSTVTKRFQK